MGKLTEKELIDKLKKVSESFITDDLILEKGFKQGVLIALEVVKNNVDLADVIKSGEHKCKFYVNANWTGYSRCKCGKRLESPAL